MRRYYPGNHSIKHLVDRFLILSLVSILLEMGVCAQSKKAVVILKPTASTKEVLTCEGQTELKFHTLYNLKLNGEKHVRLAQNISAVSDTYPVSRDDYDRARSIELENLDKMEWQEGLLYAASGTASLVICLPSDGQKKVRPDKKMPRLLREFYDISVEGESKEAGSKQKLRLPLGSIWKIYIINEADKPDEALFRHATEEASIGLWKEYLKITTTHRVDEAMTALCQSLINCVEAALKRFQEGKYAAIEVARKGANAAVSLCYKEHIQGLLQRIDEQENAVRTTIAKGITLSNEEKWDECWTTLGPVKKYADELPNLNETYNLCREHSHALHLAAGKQHLQAGRLEDAKKEFDIALLRIPDSSEAKQGRRETVILITLRDSQQLRRQGRPGEARQLVKRVLSETEYTGESRLTEELRVASCEYSNQLYDQARRLVTAPQGSGLRSITNPSDKRPFKEAREKLIEATEICSTQQVSELLLSVNRRLSEYHLAQARRALARKASATAYLHSMAAQTFHPENDGVASVLQEARDLLMQKARLRVGVVFKDRTPQQAYHTLLQELTNEVESVLQRSEAANVIVLDRNDAEQVLRRVLSGERVEDGDMAMAIFYGELRTCAIDRRSSQPRQVRIQYKIKNPNYEQQDKYCDQLENDYKRCRRASGDAACAGLKAQVDNCRAQLRQIEKCLKYDSSYMEQDFEVSGQMKLSLNVVDTISKAPRLVGEASNGFREPCLARWGVREGEKWCGFWDTPPSNQECRLSDDSTYVQRLAGPVKSEVQIKVAAALEGVPKSYFDRAKSRAGNAALEDYITFVFLTSNKKSSQVTEALKFIESQDPDLKTDGILR